MFSSEHPWTETEFNLLRTAAQSTGTAELFFWNTYPDDHHLHAALAQQLLSEKAAERNAALNTVRSLEAQKVGPEVRAALITLMDRQNSRVEEVRRPMTLALDFGVALFGATIGRKHSMTPTRAAAYIGGGLLLAAWLSSAAGVPRQPRAPRVPRATTFDAALEFDVQAQAERLRKRLAAAPAPHQPARNPFGFPDSGAPEQVSVARAAVNAPAPVVVYDPEPELTLAGVAEQQSPNGVVRTAIITGRGDELYMVVVGQAVAGRYQVVAVSADAVELRDVTTDRVRRLGLR